MAVKAETALRAATAATMVAVRGLPGALSAQTRDAIVRSCLHAHFRMQLDGLVTESHKPWSDWVQIWEQGMELESSYPVSCPIWSGLPSIGTAFAADKEIFESDGSS